MNKLKNVINFLCSPYFQVAVALVMVFAFDEFPPNR